MHLHCCVAHKTHRCRRRRRRGLVVAWAPHCTQYITWNVCSRVRLISNRDWAFCYAPIRARLLACFASWAKPSHHMDATWPVSCNIISRHGYFLSILIIGCHVCVSRTPSSFSLIAGRCWTWLTGWSHDVCCVTWLHNKNTRIWHYEKVVLSLKLTRARLSFVLRLKGRGESRIKFSLPSPSFCLNAYTKGWDFCTRLSSLVVKSKMTATALQT